MEISHAQLSGKERAMAMSKVFIPYGAYWSSPFCRWQGSFATLHPIHFAADVTRRALQEREIPTGQLDALYLGITIPSPQCFYGAPWLAGLIGAPEITGPTLSQACATSARVIADASSRLEGREEEEVILAVTADRTSNGPHLVYPNPAGPGGTPLAENWVWDNFNCDPLGRNSMIETAEKVAAAEGISTQEQHEVVLLRHAQYREALKDDSAFLRRFMVLPIEVNPSGRKVLATVDGDEGVFPTSAEGLARLKPVLKDGTVTFGGQTFPADGNAGMILTTRSRARELSRDPAIEIQVLASADGRAEQGWMPKANVPAVEKALRRAGLKVADLQAVKTHNPFAVNDIYLSRKLGLPLDAMNNFGSSLIWGHPQGPTGMRLIVELIEELVQKGGGNGLFTGCAAGDTASAVVLRVGDGS